jgi:hypothetical protein
MQRAKYYKEPRDYPSFRLTTPEEYMQRAKYYKEPRVYPYIKGSIEVCV